MSTINKVGHGFVGGERISLQNLVGGAPLDPDFVYYVLAAGLTADTFQIAETVDGAPLTFATITSATMLQITDFDDDVADATVVTYDPITDPADAEAPPTVPPAPSAPTVTSAQVSGVVRLRIELNDTAEAKVRQWQVQVTSKFDTSGNPDWTTPTTWTLPDGSTEVSMPALGATIYNVRVGCTDVYGNEGAFSPVVSHTTIAGSDALAAALAGLATDVADGIITETKIADGAISTPKLQAGSVTAQVLAATIVLASLIKTADTGRRIEIDIDGIRLYDTDESLLVRIPTNGDPVYVKGQVTADSLISQVAASFRGTVDFAGDSVATLQSGIAAPSTVPTLTTSVDSLTLTGTGLPTSALGLTYDATAGTFLVATDPSTGYVAYEYNATTGAFVRRIAATGSTSTTTTTAGSTSHVTDSADGVVGSTNSHFTTPITMPSPSGATNMKITKVSAYLAGRLGSAQCRNGVWDTSNNSLRESATYTASSGGATTLGASDHYDKALSSALSVTPGATYRVGFRHTNSTEGIQFDKDDGSGKTTYSGDGTSADGTGWGTYDSAGKPNVYVTLTYDVDTRLETAPMIAVAVDPVGGFIYTLDNVGKVWKYDRSTGAYVSNANLAADILGTKANATLFWDATNSKLVIVTTQATTASTGLRYIEYTTGSLVAGTGTARNVSGLTVNGTTDVLRGGCRVMDGATETYWVAVNGTVYAIARGVSASVTANRDFGTSTTTLNGVTHDGTQFRGFAVATPTKVWKFTNLDYTTGGSTFYFAFSWYDSNATGGTHETAVGPGASITIRRRERVQVTTPTIPTGGTDDPDNCRIYALQTGSAPSAGAWWLQATDALTARYITSYTGSGTHDGTGTAFPSGVPAVISDAGAHWQLKGDGTVAFDTTVTPGGKPPVVRVFTSGTNATYTPTTGTKWVTVEVVGGGGGGGGTAATAASASASGASGAGGGYCRKTLTAAQLASAAVTYTVGGAGSTSSGGSGGSGGQSNFKSAGAAGFSDIIANGGGGGAVGPSDTGAQRTNGPSGGSASGGDINVSGGDGGGGTVLGGQYTVSGLGGGNPLGTGGHQVANSAGTAGNSYGGGGGGATRGPSSSALAGGAGAAGVVIVTEYFGA